MNKDLIVELNEMIRLGYFGEEAKTLDVDKMSIEECAEYYLNTMLDNEKDIGRTLTCMVIVAIHYYHCQAILGNATKLINTLKNFWVNNKADETMCELMMEKVIIDKKFRDNENQILNLGEKKELSNMQLNLYMKATEFANINLKCLIDVINIYDRVVVKKNTLNERIKCLNNYDPRIISITNLVNRELRNQIAHANIRYNVDECIFTSINRSMTTITLQEMMIQKIPQILTLNRGFVCATYLFLIQYYNKEKYMDYYAKIKRIAGINV